MRVGSRFNAREARRCCSNTSEEGVKTAGLKTLLSHKRSVRVTTRESVFCGLDHTFHNEFTTLSRSQLGDIT